MISLNVIVIYLIIIIKFLFPYLNRDNLNKGSNFRLLIFLLCIPIVYLCMKFLKFTYPNNINNNIIRGISVSLTLPILILLFIFILKK